MKICRECKLPKDELEFNKDRSKTDGLTACCAPCNRQAGERWRAANLDHARELARVRVHKYRHSEKGRATAAAYDAANPGHDAAYQRRRRLEDPTFRLKELLRSRLYKVVAGLAKAGSAVQDLGCTIPELRSHLEARFYSHPLNGEAMSWANYGSWHIDHLRPLDSFDLADRQQALEACHYTNLQPLWAEHNLAKSNRIDWVLDQAQAA